MSATVIPLFGTNEFGFSHIRCADCHHTAFTVQVAQLGTTLFHVTTLHCVHCGNVVELMTEPKLKPLPRHRCKRKPPISRA